MWQEKKGTTVKANRREGSEGRGTGNYQKTKGAAAWGKPTAELKGVTEKPGR